LSSATAFNGNGEAPPDAALQLTWLQLIPMNP
jgi:hypothetical protein